MSIRPVRTEADYREALARVDSLWEKARPGTPDGDLLDVLITLIQAYERDHYSIPPPNPIEAIKFRAEQMGIGRKGLEGIIGTRARVAEVLSGSRPLSIAMIRRLHRELNIPADILIQETRRSARTKVHPKAGQKALPPAKSRSQRRSAARSSRTGRQVT